jgi:uncharacterized protein YjbJ (UPF0337 family)
MSTATEHTIHGKLNEVAGKVKQTLGEATGNDQLANEGATQQVKGHAEQAWGTVQGAAQDKYAELKGEAERKAAELKARHAAGSVEREEQAHDVRETVTSTAQNLKEHVQNVFSK